MTEPPKQRMFVTTAKKDRARFSSAVVVDAFFEILALLEDYAPVWYTEDRRNRALAAAKMLEKSATSGARGRRGIAGAQAAGLPGRGSRARKPAAKRCA